MRFNSYGNQILCLWSRVRKYFGRPEFFQKEILKEIFCCQSEENLSHHVTKNIM